MNCRTLPTLLCSSILALNACSTTTPTAPKPPTATSHTPVQTSNAPASKKQSAAKQPQYVATPKKADPLKTEPAKPKPTKITPKKVTPKKVTPQKPKKATTAATPQPATPQPVVKKKPQPVRPPAITTASKPKQTAITKSAVTPAQSAAPKKAPLPTPSIEKAEPIPTAPKQPPAPTSPSTIEVTLESLPLTIGRWTLDKSSQSDQRCSITSEKRSMPDGQGTTPVHLELTQKDALLFTKSNIDLSYTGSGTYANGTLQSPLGKLYTPTSLLFTTQYPMVISALKNNATIEFRIGFWPSWPITQTYSVTLSTEGIAPALTALAQCDVIL